MSSLSVLVTGGAGFLGSRVAASLVALGHRVVVLDVRVDQGRLDEHLPGVEVVQGDVRDEALVDGLVAGTDRVVHLAGIAGVHDYLTRADEVLDVNLLGTRVVLHAAHRHGRPVVFASTSEAYGKSDDLLREDGDTVLGPTTSARWCYAVSKLAAEHYAWALARKGLVVAAVRYFNAYGPTLDTPGTGRVLAQFLGAIRDGRPLALVDGGHAVRCLCYVDDAVDATVRLALALAPGPLSGRPFNVGNPEPVSMRELANHVVRLSGHAAGTVEVPGTTFFGQGFEEIPQRVPDVSALRDLLGWTASTPLEAGLRHTLAWWGLLRDDAPPPPPPPPVPVIRPSYDADATLMRQLRRALDEGRTTNAGPHVTALEHEAARWLGVPARPDQAEPRVISVGSGAAGLEAALLALGRSGAAILPSWTYVATLNAVERAGLRPVLCDVDPATWTLDPDHLDALLDAHPDTSVVLPVCVYGVPPDLTRVARSAAARGVAVVYDAAHAVGVRHAVDPHVLCDVVVYSTHATKVWPAIEGGVVVARDADLDARVRAVRTHGNTPDLRDGLTGFNGKQDELSAAVARHGLTRLDDVLTRRRTYDARLRDALRSAGWTVQHVPPGVLTNGQNLCALAPGERESAVATLASFGVSTRRYFDLPLHHLRRLAPHPPLLHTDAMYARLVCMPMHSRMDEGVLRTLERAIAATGRAS